LSLHARKLDNAWTKLGMETTPGRDLHARFYHGGRLILATRRSLGSGAIEGNLPHLIRQQMKLTEAEFKGVIDCPIGRSEYIEILTRKGWIEPPPPAPSVTPPKARPAGGRRRRGRRSK